MLRVKEIHTNLRKSRYYAWGMWVLAGACIGGAHMVPLLWPLAFLGIALLVRNVFSTIKFKQVFWGSYLSGIVATLLIFLNFLVGIFPFDWFGLGSTTIETIVVFASWVLIAVVLGFFVGLWGVAVRLLATRTWFDLLLIPSAWVLFEWLSSAGFYVVLYGPGSLQGIHFTMHWIGYVLAADSVFLQLASVGGVYALSFAVVFVGTGMYLFAVHRKQMQQFIYVIPIVLLLWAGAHTMLSEKHTAEQGERTLTFAVVSRYLEPQERQTPEFREEKFQELFAMVTAHNDIDVIVFPENATFVRQFRWHEELWETMAAVGTNTLGPLIIDSEDFMNSDGEVFSSVHFYRDEVTIMGNKQFLQPFGEYIPLLYVWTLSALGLTDQIEDVLRSRNYFPGGTEPSFFYKGARLAVRFCNEVMSPELYASQVREKATVLINISSLSWFHGYEPVFTQMQKLAKVRAVEHGRWFVQSGNTTPAYVLDPYGRLIVQTVWHEPEVIVREIPQKTDQTLYTKFGSWVVLLATLFVGLIITIKLFRRFAKART